MISLFDTSISTLNARDAIIMDAVNDEIGNVSCISQDIV